MKPFCAAALIGLALLSACAEPTPTLSMNVTAQPVAVTAADEAAANAYIVSNLRDPASAQFRSWRAYFLSITATA